MLDVVKWIFVYEVEEDIENIEIDIYLDEFVVLLSEYFGNIIVFLIFFGVILLGNLFLIFIIFFRNFFFVLYFFELFFFDSFIIYIFYGMMYFNWIVDMVKGIRFIFVVGIGSVE